MTEDLQKLHETAASKKPDEHDITGLVPLIMPYDWLHGDYSGPIMPLADLPFSLIWAIRSEPQYFTYVTYEMARYWEDSGIDWPEVSMKNMRRLAEAQRSAGSGEDASGRTKMVVLYADDGLGPSRLLVPDLLTDILGDDYLVAIPEATYAVAYRKGLSENEMVDINGFIEECYRVGTNPMSKERFQASRLMVKQLDVRLTYD